LELYNTNRLDKDFYNRNPIVVAQELIGKYLCKIDNDKLLIGKICETEAYLSDNDEASHSYRGITKRNKSMFDDAGNIYVYKIYGIHYCFNVVTEAKGIGSAVLIRAIEPIYGLAHMQINRGKINKTKELCSGPSKFAQAFSIDLSYDGNSLLDSKIIYISDMGVIAKIGSSARIGISKSTDLMYRFYEAGSQFVSR